jgi:hypothetical protein
MPTKNENNTGFIQPAEEPLWWDPSQRYFPTFEHEGLRLLAHLTPEYDLSVLLEMDAPLGVIGIMYPLKSYLKISEFRKALAHPLGTEPGRDWDGEFFFAYTAGHADRVYLRGHGHGITICVTAARWTQLRALFDAAFQHPEYARAWTRLTAQHGRR